MTAVRKEFLFTITSWKCVKKLSVKLQKLLQKYRTREIHEILVKKIFLISKSVDSH